MGNPTISSLNTTPNKKLGPRYKKVGVLKINEVKVNFLPYFHDKYTEQFYF